MRTSGLTWMQAGGAEIAAGPQSDPETASDGPARLSPPRSENLETQGQVMLQKSTFCDAAAQRRCRRSTLVSWVSHGDSRRTGSRTPSLQNPRPHSEGIVCGSCDSRATASNVIPDTGGKNLIGVVSQTTSKSDSGQI